MVIIIIIIIVIISDRVFTASVRNVVYFRIAMCSAYMPDCCEYLHCETTDKYGASASHGVPLRPSFHWYSLRLPTEGYPR